MSNTQSSEHFGVSETFLMVPLEQEVGDSGYRGLSPLNCLWATKLRVGPKVSVGWTAHVWFCFLFSSEGCRHLEYLNLSWCDQITKDGIEALVRGCRGLRALLLRGCTQVPGVLMAWLV